jgi:glutathione-specific gamma-glutamylcyclotransferase
MRHRAAAQAAAMIACVSWTQAPPCTRFRLTFPAAIRRRCWSARARNGAVAATCGSSATLIWRQEFEAVEHRSALVHGWHRALRMRSRVNRGTPQQPGLVFALLPGGACRGVVFRLRRDSADEELQRLWAREMPTGVYDPRWLPARTPQGEVQALAFTLSRRSEALMDRLGDAQMLHILRHASGRYGSTLQYLAATAHALRERGVHDREVQRLMALAARHGLL